MEAQSAIRFVVYARFETSQLPTIGTRGKQRTGEPAFHTLLRLALDFRLHRHFDEQRMPSLTQISKQIPLAQFRNYLATAFPDLELQLGETHALTDSGGPDPKAAAQLIQNLDEDVRTRVIHDLERVAHMGDEAGDLAMLAISGHPRQLDAMPGGYARGLWMLANEPVAFRRAEEIRYTDDHRRGRMWDGYEVPPELSVSRDPEALVALTNAVRETWSTKHAHVDVFDRSARRSDGTYEVVQVTVHREGPVVSSPAFVEGELTWRANRPVYEASVSYEPSNGALEVVARDKKTRERFAELVAEHLLSAKLGGIRISLRRYHLDRLRRRQAFPTDSEDNIDDVRVTLLRLAPLGGKGEKVTLECSRESGRTIWQSAERFESGNPLRDGWIVTQAKLSIRFRPHEGRGRARILPVTITMPHKCDLKERTERERIVGSKYLERWGLLRTT